MYFTIKLYKFSSCFCIDAFEAAFARTIYTVSESGGSQEVCVNLTSPSRAVGIFPLRITVDVYDFPSSEHIDGQALASKLLLGKCLNQ